MISSLPSIIVSAREEEGNLIISVEDDRVGISLSEKDRIYQQGCGKNTSLGLFLSREILAITGFQSVSVVRKEKVQSLRS